METAYQSCLGIEIPSAKINLHAVHREIVMRMDNDIVNIQTTLSEF